ncbi:MAG TPA: alpha/beta hydrolase [Streptosporangiaceae bacterium]|nr:alpha/beta hydrolase [Streptosporangiaceae bacterium]
MRHQVIRGVDLAVWQSGRGDQDLVFVHGFQNDHSAWSPLVERLDEDRYRFTSFDLPGCGASADAPGWERCTIGEYAGDLTALCDALGLERPVAIGHSLGAAVVVSAALAHRGRFAAAVLIAPASTSGLDFLPDEASFDSLAHPTPEQQAALARSAFRRAPADEDFAALLAVVARASARHIEGAARSMRAFKPELAALDLPSIVICGDRDRHVPLRNHLATQQAISRCGLQVYFDIGHVPFAEAPDRCAADVSRFLAKADGHRPAAPR